MSLDPRCYLLWPLLVLTIPLPWLLAAAAAAAVHEAFHLAAIGLCRGELLGIHIGPEGAVIRTGPLSNGQELICALAGPLGSLLLLCFHQHFPRISICGALQGTFNLLPCYPLDGGRAVRCCLQLIFPRHGQSLASLMEMASAGVLLFLAVRFGSWITVFLYICLLMKLLARKKPCKESPFRVQ